MTGQSTLLFALNDQSSCQNVNLRTVDAIMTRHEGCAWDEEYERLVKPHNGTRDTESEANHPNAAVKRTIATTAENATTGVIARSQSHRTERRHELYRPRN
jgi:hypothetical protein